jgi:hypothetical protein
MKRSCRPRRDPPRPGTSSRRSLTAKTLPAAMLTGRAAPPPACDAGSAGIGQQARHAYGVTVTNV